MVGGISWSGTATCEMSKISCLTGSHLVKGDLENVFKTSNSFWFDG